ncbi:MAG: DUF2793 domain-containing protein [Acidobacteria bacterium]|nr:DUF2793 domain-containing protein [Acidobacteriota bacterium]
MTVPKTTRRLVQPPSAAGAASGGTGNYIIEAERSGGVAGAIELTDAVVAGTAAGVPGATVKAQIEATYAAALDAGANFKDPAINILTTPPGSPTNGDRYIAGVGSTGAWAGHDNDIVDRTAGAWVFTTSVAGWIINVRDWGTANSNAQFRRSTGGWVEQGVTVIADQVVETTDRVFLSPTQRDKLDDIPDDAVSEADHVGAGGDAHANAVASVDGAGGAAGFITPASQEKLNGIAVGAEVNPADLDDVPDSATRAAVHPDRLTPISNLPSDTVTALAGKAATSHTHDAATASAAGVGGAAGFMSAASQEKLDGVEEGAQVNPAAMTNAHIDALTDTTERTITAARLGYFRGLYITAVAPDFAFQREATLLSRRVTVLQSGDGDVTIPGPTGAAVWTVINNSGAVRTVTPQFLPVVFGGTYANAAIAPAAWPTTLPKTGVQALTISVWVYPTELSTALPQYILSTYSGEADAAIATRARIEFGLRSANGGELGFFATNQAGVEVGRVAIPITTSGLVASTWNHIAFSFDGVAGTARFRINGVARTPTNTLPGSYTVAWGNTDGTNPTGRSFLTVGNRFGKGANGWRGALGQFWLDDSFTNLDDAPTLAKLYTSSTNSPRDLGANGTATSLSPAIFLNTAARADSQYVNAAPSAGEVWTDVSAFTPLVTAVPLDPPLAVPLATIAGGASYSLENGATATFYVENSGSGLVLNWIVSDTGTGASTTGGAARIYSGDGAPSSTLGATGDTYIDEQNGDLFVKEAAGWGAARMRIQGAPGAPGSGYGTDPTVAPYNADATGAADSTAAIQAALDAGRHVHLRAGLYRWTTLRISDVGGVLSGDGPYATEARPYLPAYVTDDGSAARHGSMVDGIALAQAVDSTGVVTIRADGLMGVTSKTTFTIPRRITFTMRETCGRRPAKPCGCRSRARRRIGARRWSNTCRSRAASSPPPNRSRGQRFRPARRRCSSRRPTRAPTPSGTSRPARRSCGCRGRHSAARCSPRSSPR